MNMDRLKSQIQFIMEIDQLKNIFRQSYISDGSRNENDAEHSWHLAMMAIILAEHANEQVDMVKVLKMVLIHDIVEIDAGDTFAYDEKGHEDKEEREQKAAKRLFAMLPEDQYEEYYGIWIEFELEESAEAKFSHALDRIHPMLLNWKTEGVSWKKHQISSEQVNTRNKKIAKGSELLWEYAQEIIQDAIEKGYLKR